ncbi:amidohydrolase [Rhizobium sp. CG5]|nr:amidohydrolase [Rhizobium sp. CG5]
MQSWRKELHRFPELGYQEFTTAEFLQARLSEFGLEFFSGIAGTGIVARLAGQGLSPAIGLRADMDALPIQEHTGLDYASTNTGVMHACGHDGHMAMLLGAALEISRMPRPPGDVYFIFQPAEEIGAGARRMIEDGLFKIAPVEKIFGLHNWPDLPQGLFSVCNGAQMASVDYFDVTISGKGCHAAMPHSGNDSLLAASQIHQMLQSIASRNLDPLESGVVSVTQIHGGEAYNVLPETTVMRGCTRSLAVAVGRKIEARMAEICVGVAGSLGVTVQLDYRHGYPVLVNTNAEVTVAKSAAAASFGGSMIDLAPSPSMASEDFAFMLNECPGAYAFLGAGDDTNSRLHSPAYRFNDSILPLGADWWVTLAHQNRG